MGYANRKGWDGQQEVKTFLEKDVFSPFGYRFLNVTGSEKNKKVLAGDVCLDRSSDREGSCVLDGYFIEVKKHSHPSVFNIVEKAKDDAAAWGKRDYLAFITRSVKGVRYNQFNEPDRLVVMSWRTFRELMQQLQGYVSDDTK